MVVEKNENELKGISLLMIHNSIGLDVFIKKNSTNFSEAMASYTKTSRVTIKVNYANWESTILFFEEKVSNEYFLLQKVSLKNFIKRGNAIVFNPIPSILTNTNSTRKKDFYTNLSELNNYDIQGNIDYKTVLEVFLKENLKIKNNDIVRFDKINL